MTIFRPILIEIRFSQTFQPSNIKFDANFLLYPKGKVAKNTLKAFLKSETAIFWRYDVIITLKVAILTHFDRNSVI